MLVEKEVIRPGVYWYRDEATGLPRKLVVTPELTKYWHEQGNAMLSAGLTVPVPYEHDFTAHPMTPKDKLLNNAGEVKEYRLKGDALFSAVDVQDPAVKDKIGHSIRWTSPWISSFTDGDGKEWKNVISHLALTTRPRVIKQQPFSGIAAALSIATEIKAQGTTLPSAPSGFCLSKAGRLAKLKHNKRVVPRYPMAFSMWAGGVPLAESDFPPKKDKAKSKDKSKKPKIEGGGEPDTDLDIDVDVEESDDTAYEDEGGGSEMPTPEGEGDTGGIPGVLQDAGGDVKMEELLCDLLQALGVPMPDQSNEHEFRRHLYEAVMSKIKELTSKGMGKEDENLPNGPDQNQPPDQQPNASQPNPLIKQEQQPMFMSLEDIHKISDPTMKNVALSMYNENAKLRAEMDASKKVADSLRDAKLKEATAQRGQRVAMLSRLSPKVKADLDAMMALPTMALSMGDGGAVNDPMAQTLSILEKGLGDIPTLLTTDRSAISLAAQPQDADLLDDKRSDELADDMARRMGCPPTAKAS